MPPLSPAKPSTEPSRLNPGRVGPDSLMCDINCTPIVWAFHSPAGSCLLQLFYYDSFVTIGLLCIFDMRLMANETIPEEKSHQGHRWIKGILPCTPTHWGLECFKKKKRKKKDVCFLNSSSGLVTTEIPDVMSSYFCISCLCPGSWNLSVFPYA